MNNTLISIIIPAYNVGKYIVKCLTSIISQTYSNIEIIVVNDGSSDNTKELVEQISQTDNRIKLYNCANSGVSASRNFGLEIATGNWIVFVDGDDYLSEDYVEYMLSVVTCTGAEYCINTDCFISVNDKQSNFLSINELSSEESTAMLLSHRIQVGCWNKLFSKKLLDRNNIRFNTSLFYGEGLHFITQVSQYAPKTVVINKKLYFYRQNNENSATKHFNIDKIHNGWKALDEIEKGLIIKSKLIQKRLNQHRCLFALNAVTKILNSKVKKQYFKEYQKYKKYVSDTMKICVTDESIPNIIKIKLILCCVCPLLLSYLSLKSQKRKRKESV